MELGKQDASAVPDHSGDEAAPPPARTLEGRCKRDEGPTPFEIEVLLEPDDGARVHDKRNAWRPNERNLDFIPHGRQQPQRSCGLQCHCIDSAPAATVEIARRVPLGLNGNWFLGSLRCEHRLQLRPQVRSRAERCNRGEMIVSAGLTIGQSRPHGRAIARRALTALCKAWTVRTLKRAIADVASTSDRDYRAFGLDKAEMIAALRRLRDEIEGDGGALAPTHAGRRASGPQLAIVVTKRTAGTLVSPGPTVSETSTA